MKPTVVVVHLSDSHLFPQRDRYFQFQDFEQLAIRAATMPLPDNSNENRTEVTVVFDNQEEFSCTLFLTQHMDLCLQDYFADLQVQIEDTDFSKSYGEVLAEFLDRIHWTQH